MHLEKISMQTEALQWIAGVLIERQIPYQICGGLAAIAYGSDRPLNDIDLFVPRDRFAEVVSAGRPFISKPAQHYCEGEWDLEYVQFLVDGTKIEVGNASGARIRDAATGEWTALKIDFSKSQKSVLLGIEVPLMEAQDLISYKTTLGRTVDQLDIEAIKQHVEAL